MVDLAQWARAALFDWILPPEPARGALGAMARPGLYHPLARDLEALAALEVQTIVNLTEDPLPAAAFARFTVVDIPIEPMDAPSAEQVDEFCALVDDARRADRRVVCHCLAGIGRTGAMTASYLVHGGLAPDEAIRQVRSRRLALQNREQEEAVFETAARRAGSS